jgi:hypothetical protein
MEVIDPGPDIVFAADDRLEDGAIVLGEALGLGLTFDEEALVRHAVDRPSDEALNRLYRRAPDSGISEPGVPRRGVAGPGSP